ncbi:HNH endonuclease [Rhodococcus erythropolis]|nr:HNH endonuclease [Rhodococcus qingshengii]MBS2991742.1 HNH endonuclease [Rhodococcus erythropolis]QSE41550.1 HNH endonuclease [Rhodococcus erythropolis]
MHHILPRKYGGTNEFWNLVPLPTSIHALFTRWWEFYADIYN